MAKSKRTLQGESGEANGLSVPDDWNVSTLGELIEQAQYGLSKRGETEGRYPILRMNNLRDGLMDTANLQFVDLDSNTFEKFRLKDGDVLFNRTNSIELVGKTGLFALPGDFVFASYLIRVRPCPDRIDPAFLNFYLNAQNTQARLKLLASRGVSQSNINATKLKAFPVPVPRLSEQKAIAGILRTVQEARASTQKVIEATRQLKASLMRHLLAYGSVAVDEVHRVELVETEAGVIPRHWKTVRLGDIGRIGNGSTPKRSNPLYWKGGDIPWLTSGKIHEVVIRQADAFVTETAKAECHLPSVKAGSILVAITGQGKTLGNAALVTFDACINQHLAYLQFPDDDVENRFVLAFLQGRYRHLRQVAQGGGSTKGALTCGFLKTYPVPLPPLEEQRAIADAFSALNDKLEVEEARKKSLGLLFYSLLNDLMTGKMRVGDALQRSVEVAEAV